MFFAKKAKDQEAKVESRAAIDTATSAEPCELREHFVTPAPHATGGKHYVAAAARQASATFGEIITLFMRSQEYKSLTLGDIETLVLPPLRIGQVSVATAQSKDNGATVPVGALLWARVSADVAARLASDVGKPVQLTPSEWQSGDIIWIVASVGDGRVLSEMLKELSRRDWAGKEVRIVVRPKDGKPTVARLAVQSSQAA